MIGVASTTSPIAAGMLITRIKRMPLRYEAAMLFQSPAAACFEISGKTTVDTATANTPIGNSINRLARLSTVTAESLSECPIKRDTAMLIR